MTKTTSGFILIAGPVIASIGGGISSHATTAESTPETDWQYSALNAVGIGVILAGLAMFFFGAMMFSKTKR